MIAGGETGKNHCRYTANLLPHEIKCHVAHKHGPRLKDLAAVPEKCQHDFGFVVSSIEYMDSHGQEVQHDAAPRAQVFRCTLYCFVGQPVDCRSIFGLVCRLKTLPSSETEYQVLIKCKRTQHKFIVHPGIGTCVRVEHPHVSKRNRISLTSGAEPTPGFA
jgi:hypothetical protein